MDIKPALTYFRQGGLAYLPYEELLSLKKNIDAAIKEKTFEITLEMVCSQLANEKFTVEKISGSTLRDQLISFLGSLKKKSKNIKKFLVKLINKPDFLPQIFYCTDENGFERTITIEEFNKPAESAIYMIFSQPSSSKHQTSTV